MTSVLSYKGYEALIRFDAERMVLYGEVAQLRDPITFEATSISELTTAFEEAVDDYLEWCQELGVKPDKPYSGRFVIRTDPGLHRRCVSAAAAQGTSLNTFVVRALSAAVDDTSCAQARGLRSTVAAEDPEAARRTAS